MCQHLFPNFPVLAHIPQQDLFANIPWTPATSYSAFECGLEKLIELDPFIKNHIAFGTSQLKVRNG